MSSTVLDQARAAATLLTGLRDQADLHASSSRTQAKKIAERLKRTRLDDAALGSILTAVEQAGFAPEDLLTLKRSIAMQTEGPAVASLAGKYQNYESVLNMMPQHVWDAMRGDDGPTVLCEFLVDLRFFSGDEASFQLLAVLLLMSSEGAAKASTYSSEMKNQFMKALRRWFDTCYKNRADHADATQTPVIMKLPASPDEFRELYPAAYDFAFRNGPPARCPHDRIAVEMMRDGRWMRLDRRSRQRSTLGINRQPSNFDMTEVVQLAVGQCMQGILSQFGFNDGGSRIQLSPPQGRSPGSALQPPQGRSPGSALQRLRSALSQGSMAEEHDHSGRLVGPADEASCAKVQAELETMTELMKLKSELTKVQAELEQAKAKQTRSASPTTPPSRSPKTPRTGPKPATAALLALPPCPDSTSTAQAAVGGAGAAATAAQRTAGNDDAAHKQAVAQGTAAAIAALTKRDEAKALRAEERKRQDKERRQRERAAAQAAERDAPKRGRKATTGIDSGEPATKRPKKAAKRQQTLGAGPASVAPVKPMPASGAPVTPKLAPPPLGAGKPRRTKLTPPPKGMRIDDETTRGPNLLARTGVKISGEQGSKSFGYTAATRAGQYKAAETWLLDFCDRHGFKYPSWASG